MGERDERTKVSRARVVVKRIRLSRVDAQKRQVFHVTARREYSGYFRGIR
jgi:hypothetical protein